MTQQKSDVARMLAGRARLAEMATLFSMGMEPPPPISPSARRQLRSRMFRERPLDQARRYFKAARAALLRDGFGGCLRAIELLAREKSIGAAGLPDPTRALASPDGLCGVADDLSVGTIMDAYERGLYPSAHIGPMKWWAPSHRAIIPPATLAQRLGDIIGDRYAGITVAFDQDFESALCNERLEQPTPPRLKWAFARLFDAGFAHSFDIVAPTGERIGGGFGVAVGRVFVIEAMQFKDRASTEAGLAALARGLAARDFAWIDAKRLTPDLARCGFDETPRIGYVARLKAALGRGKVGRWTRPLQESAREASREAAREAA
jgi:leucyl/phenylalanyl-tRNA---protein transferase